MLLNVREGGPIGVTTEGETYFQHETVVSGVGLTSVIKRRVCLGMQNSQFVIPVSRNEIFNDQHVATAGKSTSQGMVSKLGVPKN